MFVLKTVERFTKYTVNFCIHQAKYCLASNWSSSNAFVSGVRRLKFKSRAIKSDAAVLPTVRYRCDISSKGAALPIKRNVAEMSHANSLHHRLFVRGMETDSVVFFSYVSFVLKHADSSNQCDFFLHGSLVLQKCPIKSVEYAWPQKTFATRAFFFLQCSSFFLRASVSSLLNTTSTVTRLGVPYNTASVMKDFICSF